MKKIDQLTKIYLESVKALSGPITSKEIAEEIYRIYDNLDPNAKTKSGGLVRDELKILVDELINSGLID